MKVVLITGLWGKRNYSIFRIATKLIDLLEPLSEQLIWVVTNPFNECELSDSVKQIKIVQDELGGTYIEKMCQFIYYQLKIIRLMFGLIMKNEVELFIFSFGADLFLLPILMGRLFKKKVVFRIDGRASIIARENLGIDNDINIFILSFIERMNYLLADRIAIAFEYLMERYHLEEYYRKIDISTLYIENHFFIETKPMKYRIYKVGYIGGLNRLKGCMEFTKALPRILDNSEDRALIIGKGELEDQVKDIIKKENLNDKVRLVGWIDNKDLPKYLNDIQILVLPSYSEGLPNIISEAMACGCIVLATSVGGIPNILKDRDTGFILKCNDPKCIVESVNQIILFPKLDSISQRARSTIKAKFDFCTVLKRYKSNFELYENIR